MMERAMTRPEAMRLAREMWAAWWSAPEIARYLEGHGVKISNRTAWRWATGAIETSDDNHARVARRRDARVLARITELRDRRVSFSAIAAVLSVDFKRDVSTDQVRWCVATGKVSGGLHRTLFGQEQAVTRPGQGRI